MATTLSFSSTNLTSILKNPKTLCLPNRKHLYITSSSSAPKARFVARRQESVSVTPLQRPLLEYMSLPASQYSVLDAQRIERIDDNTFRCYVYRFKFFAFEVCPVLLVRVEQQPNGCCINLLSCQLEGSPIVVAQNNKFDEASSKKKWWGQNISTGHGKNISWLGYHKSGLENMTTTRKPCFFFAPWSALTLIWCGHAASMENRISCHSNGSISSIEKLTSDTTIEVNIEIPFAFRAIPVQAIESSGAQVLEQILKIMLPRFMAQLVKDYQAWASGDASRQALGTGQI